MPPVFLLTRGQFSLVDAIKHVVEACAPARVSVWTWRIAEHDLDVMHSLSQAGKITSGMLVIDQALARIAESGAVGRHLGRWVDTFGAGSVTYLKTHAKIATVEGAGMRVLIRGSCNLNCNRRFENLDISEGCAGFELMRSVEAELPVVHGLGATAEADAALSAGSTSQFGTMKVWAP